MGIQKHLTTNKCKQWELLKSRIDINDHELLNIDMSCYDELIPYYKDQTKTDEYIKHYGIKLRKLPDEDKQDFINLYKEIYGDEWEFELNRT